MADPICKVFETIRALAGLIDSGRLSHPRLRQRAEDLFKLLEDISHGSGGPDHLPALFKSLAAISLELGKEKGAEELIRIVGDTLNNHQEVLTSHIVSHNCPTGDCAKLAPAPCQMACPAGLDVPGFITLIAENREAEAVRLIRKDNPFPWVCGLVCTHPCEFMCVRGRIDTPIAIKDLHGFAAEKAMFLGRYDNPEKAADLETKVGIIGAGPAGLTAAYYLALKGYRVVVIEALPYAGGMMMVGIPRYRLPREVIDREVSLIEALGVDFRFNLRFGRDVGFDELKQEGLEAFFISVGAHDSIRMHIEGESDFPQVSCGVEFLKRVALGERHRPGRNIAVIGGGNVAIDAARTCLRLGAETVTIVYRRTRSEMPASKEEMQQAEEEGIRFSFLTIPVKVEGSGGRVAGLECVRTALGPPDESGRRRPVPVEGSNYRLDVDAVITAIGQRIDPLGLTALPGIEWSRRQTLVARTTSMETGMEGVFAGGDVVLGPATVVEAIGAGKKAADAIDRFCRGIPQPKLPSVPIRRQRLACREIPAATKMSLKRPQMPLLNSNRRRITFQQVELGLTEQSAREETYRCLRCDICIRCGRCVEVCRDMMKIDALQMRHFDFDHPLPTDFRITAEKCILCGACAANCPTEAMKMEDRGDERILLHCGTILNRLKLEFCEACNVVLGPEKYHDYVNRKVKGVSPVIAGRRLCISCARKLFAQPHTNMAPAVKSDSREKGAKT